jgi:hypothetical protein
VNFWVIRRFRRPGLALIAATLILTSIWGGPARAGDGPIPTLAYYYIWFNASSWNRAKTDYPSLGRYSSDEGAVMRQHIQWARQAGIRGFIVSWKGTESLNARLAKLVRIADEEDFKLAIIYQGLDFYRQPLPIWQVRSDLRRFSSRWGDDRAFDLFARPLVVWSGTWEFSPDEVRRVTEPLRDRLLILASERSPEEYGRVSEYVDGDAYYWSSVNPDTYAGYPQKLAAMSGAVHADGGLWIAPAAPGFDARLVGGSTIVPRKSGETLRTQYAAAIASEPDAIGIISWNEFSENSHIEPSVRYGDRYLRVMADILHAPSPRLPDFDSSAPQGTSGQLSWPVVGLGGLALLTAGSVIVIARRKTPTLERGRS